MAKTTLVRWEIIGRGQISIWDTNRANCYTRLNCCPDCDRFFRRYPVLRFVLTRYNATAPDPMAANGRAKELFLSLLTEKQRSFYLEYEYVDFIAQSGDKYRLLKGYSGNVIRDRNSKSYCAYVHDRVPVYDHMIAQLLCLKYDEQHFLDTAY